ncbi:unnamed protein product [Trichogramma brassicae]|uniref:Uncharacterized protein n=1 Tax=Trichogramma brassicae TaxID=86971 RepID=A0A6H5IBV9_9HYME|nr:unnamed protein product [Trichogramma brassicae]
MECLRDAGATPGVNSTQTCKRTTRTTRQRDAILAPRSRILISHGRRVTCDKRMPPMFKIKEQWFRIMPDMIDAPALQIIKLLSRTQWKYASTDALAVGGVYAEKDQKKYRDLIVFPLERPSVLNQVAMTVTPSSADRRRISASLDRATSPPRLKRRPPTTAAAAAPSRAICAALYKPARRAAARIRSGALALSTSPGPSGEVRHSYLESPRPKRRVLSRDPGSNTNHSDFQRQSYQKKLRETLNAYADILISLSNAYLCRLTADDIARASQKDIEDASARLELACCVLTTATSGLNDKPSTYASVALRGCEVRTSHGPTERVSLSSGKSFNIKRCDKIVISPSQGSATRYPNSSATKDALIKCVDPVTVAVGIGVSRLSFGLNNTVVIEGDSLDSDRLKDCKSLRDAGLEVRQDAKMWPRVAVHDIPVDFLGDNICCTIIS